MALQQLFEDLQDNLSPKCCGTFILEHLPKNARYIKLYNRRKDACEENNRFKWYDIARIHANNNIAARTTGIVCYKCPDHAKCVVSLRIDEKNTRFAVIEKIEFK